LPISFTEGVLAALEAGCDLALLCNQSLNGSKIIDEVLDGLAEAQVKGWWQPNELSEARRMALLPTLPALAWEDLVRAVNYQQALACLP
jgi:beta-N-acetylhexosaminidase